MRRRFWKIFTSLWLIVAVATGTRLLYSVRQAQEIPAHVLATVPFATETGNIAQSLAGGHGFSSPFRIPTGPTAWLAPVYPLLLAGIFRIWGTFTLGAFFAAVALNILCSAGACVPLFFAGKRVAGTGVAAGAAWLWALFPNGVIIPFQWIWDTSLSVLLATTILWATLAVAESEKKRDWIAYGLLWAFALLTNPSLGSLGPFLLGWMAWRAHKRGRGWVRGPALTAAVIVLCCLPWTVRNYATFHRWVPLRSAFPEALWLGNNEVLDPNGPNVMARVTNYGEIRSYEEMGETAFMQERWREATGYMRTHPRLTAWLAWRRLVAMWIGSPTPVANFRGAGSRFIQFLYVLNVLAMLGMLAGIFAIFWRRNPCAFPVVAFPVVYPVVYYIAQASLRYRNPIDPEVMLLACVAMAELFRKAGGTGPERESAEVAAA